MEDEDKDGASTSDGGTLIAAVCKQENAYMSRFPLHDHEKKDMAEMAYTGFP